MFPRVLERMRELVRASRYVVTLHATEEMDADDFTVYDVEHCVLTGRIISRQRDRVTAEWKYLVQGSTVSGNRGVVVARIGPTGTLVIITVYEL